MYYGSASHVCADADRGGSVVCYRLFSPIIMSAQENSCKVGDLLISER